MERVRNFLRNIGWAAEGREEEKIMRKWEKVLLVQFEFARLMSDREGIDLRSAVEYYTSLDDSLHTDKFIELDDVVADRCLEDFNMSLHEIPLDISPSEFASQALKNLKNILENNERKHPDYTTDDRAVIDTGPFSVNAVVIDNNVLEEKVFGLDSGTRCLEMHFDLIPLSRRIVNPRKEFAKIAVQINRQNLDFGYMIGCSWLLDTPVGKQLGFEIRDRLHSDPTSNPNGPYYRNAFTKQAYWGQLIDGYGNIKPDVKKYLFEHRHLPYSLVAAVMTKEDF